MQTIPSSILINLGVSAFAGAKISVQSNGFQDPMLYASIGQDNDLLTRSAEVAPHLRVEYKPNGYWADAVSVDFSLKRKGCPSASLQLTINHSAGGRDDSLNEIETAKSFVASYAHALDVAEKFSQAFEAAVAQGIRPAAFFFAVKDELFDKLDNIAPQTEAAAR